MGQGASHVQIHLIRNKNAAKHILDSAESVDFYLAECRDNPANQRSRIQLAYAPNEISNEDAYIFNALVESSKDKIPLRLCSELSQVHVIQLMPSAEGGMPHTRANSIICYPQSTSLFSMTTLIHELWHIHQRQYPKWWKSVFAQLEWTPWEGQLPDTLEAYRRLNPDTIDSPLWCYQKTWVPVPIFRDITQPKVNEVGIWFYHITLRYHVKNIPKEFEIYRSMPMSAYEHPREMAAYLLSDTTYSNCPAFPQWIEAVGAISLPRI